MLFDTSFWWGWSLIGPFNGRVDYIEFDFSTNTLYVGTHGGGVFKTLDNGKNWKSLCWYRRRRGL